MTTENARRDILAQIALDIRRCGQMLARAEQPSNDWRQDALERAGELALGGRLAESREAARKGQE